MSIIDTDMEAYRQREVAKELWCAAYTDMEARHQREAALADDEAMHFWRIKDPITRGGCPEASYGPLGDPEGCQVYSAGTAWIYGTEAQAVAYAHECEEAWLSNPGEIEDDGVADYLERQRPYIVWQADSEVEVAPESGVDRARLVALPLAIEAASA